MVPLLIFETAQPWWVHLEEKALNWPAVGWVTPTPLSAKTLPPPSGMSAVFASAPPFAPPAGAGFTASLPVVLSELPHPVRATAAIPAAPTAPTAVTTVLRSKV